MKLTDALFPRGAACLACGRPSYGDDLCARCRMELDARQLREPPKPGVFIEGVCSAWVYEGAAQALVYRLKFDAAAAAADTLAAGMIKAVRLADLPEKLVVTSVPMLLSRRRERGVDHGVELAVRVATGLNRPYRPMLRRVGKAKTQRGLSRGKRMTNLQGAFVSEPLHGEMILLVDDVFTTGATVQTCAQALREAGAGDVWVVTATRAKPPQPRGLRWWLKKISR